MTEEIGQCKQCKQCKHCIYFKKSTPPYDKVDGWCMRYPPTFYTLEGDSGFPDVELHNWCGEFKMESK